MIEKISFPIKMIAGPFSPYLNWRETAILIELTRRVKPRVFIEFGCNVGVTAKRVLGNVPSIKKYIGVDVPSDSVTPLRCQQGEVPVNPGCLVNDVRFHLLLAERKLTPDDLEKADAVFIDGDHSFDGVMQDTMLARAVVRPGGLIAWHDYSNRSVEVTEALDALAQEGWPIKQVEGSWIAYVNV